MYKGVQKFKCKSCKKCQRLTYRNRKYTYATDVQIKALSNESVGISSISRILSIPKTSVQRRIRRTSNMIVKPVHHETGEEYEVDELYTFIGRKDMPCYIVYAINRKTKQVIDFVCGTRSKENIGQIIRAILCLSPKRIYTDKLNIFSALIR